MWWVWLLRTVIAGTVLISLVVLYGLYDHFFHVKKVWAQAMDIHKKADKSNCKIGFSAKKVDEMGCIDAIVIGSGMEYIILLFYFLCM